MKVEAAISARAQATAATRVLGLPLRAGLWTGQSGPVQGAGTGNSLDFQDQRPYAPGDDPRHINWQAFARTSAYTMKLYRQEVSPRVDLLVDLSASMFLTPAKTQRTWELIWFCIESALRQGAAIRIQTLFPTLREVPLEQAHAGDWPLPTSTTDSREAAPGQVPLRPGSLRVLVSDLLFPGAPDAVLNALTQSPGRVAILAPHCDEESSPDWLGNVEFEDAESLALDHRRVVDVTLSRYLEAYRRHFALWQQAAQRRGMAFAQVGSQTELIAALRHHALPSGAVHLL